LTRPAARDKVCVFPRLILRQLGATMADSDTDRLHLYEVAREHWGEQAATTLMSAFPPAREELATKSDVTAMGLALRSEMAELGGSLRSEMAELGGSLRVEIGEVRTEIAALGGSLRTSIAEVDGSLRADMHQEFARVYEKMNEQTRTLVLAMIGMVISAMSLAFAAARWA